MISPAARHWSQAQPVVLPRGGATAQTEELEPALEEDWSAEREFRLIKIKLAEDVRRLSAIRSRQRANDVKRELLPSYQDYCQLAINRHDPRHDPVLNRLCVWHFDLGEFQSGLVLAEAALAAFMTKPGGYRHTLAPDGFKRSLAEVLTEILADTVLKSTEPSAYEGYVLKLAELVRSHDMTDPVTAKLHRARALVLMDSNPKTALFHWKEAYALRPLSAIAKRIKRLEQQLQTM